VQPCPDTSPGAGEHLCSLVNSEMHALAVRRRRVCTSRQRRAFGRYSAHHGRRRGMDGIGHRTGRILTPHAQRNRLAKLCPFIRSRLVPRDAAPRCPTDAVWLPCVRVHAYRSCARRVTVAETRADIRGLLRRGRRQSSIHMRAGDVGSTGMALRRGQSVMLADAPASRRAVTPPRSSASSFCRSGHGMVTLASSKPPTSLRRAEVVPTRDRRVDCSTRSCLAVSCRAGGTRRR